MWGEVSGDDCMCLLVYECLTEVCIEVTELVCRGGVGCGWGVGGW